MGENFPVPVAYTDSLFLTHHAPKLCEKEGAGAPKFCGLITYNIYSKICRKHVGDLIGNIMYVADL